MRCARPAAAPHAQVGSSRFSVADIHRIGILDLRLFNTDRHAGNILAVRPPRPAPPGPAAGRLGASSPGSWARSRLASETMALIPIDHGFCLPEALEPPYFEWLHWAGVSAAPPHRASLTSDSDEYLMAHLNRTLAIMQEQHQPSACRYRSSTILFFTWARSGLKHAQTRQAMTPFSKEELAYVCTLPTPLKPARARQAMIPFSEEELAYIARLDVAADIALLRAELPSLHQGCLRVLEISTTLLQRRAPGAQSVPLCAPSSCPMVAPQSMLVSCWQVCWPCALLLCGSGGPVLAWSAGDSLTHCRQL